MIVMTERESERRISKVNATMAMEGMPLTEDDKKLLREVNRGNISFEQAMKMTIEEFSSK